MKVKKNLGPKKVWVQKKFGYKKSWVQKPYVKRSGSNVSKTKLWNLPLKFDQN